MTPKEEIRVLERLSQTAAAWLLKKSPRRLRDTDCPRNRDGTYSARDVLAWRLDRLTPAQIVEAVDHLDGKQLSELADVVVSRLQQLLKS